MLLYVLTIFLGAFLVFQIQPMIAKVILPWFGGSASVWSACMLFFQVVLLLGYLYAHFMVRTLRARVQAIVHVSLLAVSLLLLRVIPNPAWKPGGDDDPVLAILGLLTMSVGLPYLLLSTTGPLMQAWYARSHQVAFPYRLYAVSNFGSLLALVTYPVLFEPYLATSNQARIWSVSYAVFAALAAACGWLSLRPRAPEPAAQAELPVVSGEEAAEPPVEPRPPAWYSYVLWTLLAACSSTMLLAVTNYVCQNIAPVPFLWILPLSLYLLSFILTFGRESWYSQGAFTGLLALLLSGMCYGLGKFDGGTNLYHVVPLFAGGLFVACMVCHGELAVRRPHASHLTGFYLAIALGGALGGLFVGGLAPSIFRGFWEMPIAIFFCAVMALVVFRNVYKWVYAGWAFLAIVLGLTLYTQERETVRDSRLMVRNFYGALRVTQSGGLQDPFATRTLVHGTITHGLQYLSPQRRRLHTTYYGSQSGVGLAIENTRRSAQRVGVIGLGTGTLAGYGRPGDYYRIYEINPLVPEIAKREFTYLMESEAKIDVVLGDARLSLEREPSQQFDVLAVDAFSSDAIPVHLLTLEAFRVYFRHLRPDGILAVHVSNSHLRLEPVVQSAADALGRHTLLIDTDDSADLVYGATWVLLASDPEVLNKPAFKGGSGRIKVKPGFRPWTDDYSNLWRILK
ncbi:MAG: spermidine synthase [Bryobacteraceae bacterium]